MSHRSQLNRRSFLEQSAAAGLSVPLFVSAAARGVEGTPGANDKIQLGLIGAGGMGNADLANCAKP